MVSWKEHGHIIRGDPVRVYEGERSILKKKEDLRSGRSVP